MTASIITGVVPILITPFDSQGRIDSDSLQSLIDFNINSEEYKKYYRYTGYNEEFWSGSYNRNGSITLNKNNSKCIYLTANPNSEGELISIDLETTSLDPLNTNIAGIAISLEDNTGFLILFYDLSCSTKTDLC